MKTELKAKARLLASSAVVLAHQTWDKTFHKLYTGQSDKYSTKTKEAGAVTVDIIFDESPEMDKMHEKYPGGDLMSNVPNIEFVVAGKKVLLTWDEAYNIGFTLIRTSELAYYG